MIIEIFCKGDSVIKGRNISIIISLQDIGISDFSRFIPVLVIECDILPGCIQNFGDVISIIISVVHFCIELSKYSHISINMPRIRIGIYFLWVIDRLQRATGSFLALLLQS